MNILDLNEELQEKGIKTSLYEDKGKIYLPGSKKFQEYLVDVRGDFYIKVYLRKKKFGESYTTPENRECFERREEIVSELNALDLSVHFNQMGDTTKVEE